MFDFDVRSGQDAAMPHAAMPQMIADISTIRALREQLNEPVIRVPRRPPLVLAPSCGLREALKLMGDRHAAVALVASHGVPLGMLEERELFRRVLELDAPTGDLPVWRVMAADGENLLDTDTIAFAVRRLSALGGKAMPIVRPSGTLTGILETQDVLAWLCERVGDAASDPRIGRTKTASGRATKSDFINKIAYIRLLDQEDASPSFP